MVSTIAWVSARPSSTFLNGGISGKASDGPGAVDGAEVEKGKGIRPTNLEASASVPNGPLRLITMFPFARRYSGASIGDAQIGPVMKFVVSGSRRCLRRRATN